MTKLFRVENMKRVITALIGVPIILAIILLLPSLYFALLVAFAVLIMLYEYFRMLGKNAIKPYKLLGYVLVIFIMVIFYLNMESLTVLYFVIPVSILLFSLIQKEEFDAILLRSSMSMLGILYIGGLSSYLIALRRFNGDDKLGKELLLLLMGIVWFTDTGAYYVGSKLGKHPLTPRISPKKTIEGTIGGVAAGIVGGVLVNLLFHRFIRMEECIVISIVISIIGQCGDLVESLIKRALKTKDAGSILPGHGGIMDRMDAVIFSAPFMYLYFYMKLIINQ